VASRILAVTFGFLVASSLADKVKVRVFEESL